MGSDPMSFKFLGTDHFPGRKGFDMIGMERGGDVRIIASIEDPVVILYQALSRHLSGMKGMRTCLKPPSQLAILIIPCHGKWPGPLDPWIKVRNEGGRSKR